jgi:hypothetical protein
MDYFPPVRTGSRVEFPSPAKWKEWRVSGAVASKIGYECIIGSMS